MILEWQIDWIWSIIFESFLFQGSVSFLFFSGFNSIYHAHLSCHALFLTNLSWHSRPNFSPSNPCNIFLCCNQPPNQSAVHWPTPDRLSSHLIYQAAWLLVCFWELPAHYSHFCVYLDVFIFVETSICLSDSPFVSTHNLDLYKCSTFDLIGLVGNRGVWRNGDLMMQLNEANLCYLAT